ncbi:MAG: hypothetical protein IT158_02430 [Bryobacterales bacterium]|nr:hypothetical protein [Bryobacterales bacterium]
MVRLVSLVALLAVCLGGAPQKRKGRPLDVELLEPVMRRSGEDILIDGRLRNCAAKPIRGLVLVFDFMAPGRQVVTTYRGALDEELLEPGQESEFRMQVKAPPRVVAIQVAASDEEGRDLRVGNPGPFVIQ